MYACKHTVYLYNSEQVKYLYWMLNGWKENKKTIRKKRHGSVHFRMYFVKENKSYSLTNTNLKRKYQAAEIVDYNFP
jgi:hypothetical protein